MHTHLSDIRSLYCPLKFSGSQISIDERVSIEHLWDPARNQSCGQPIFISLPPTPNPSLHPLHQRHPSSSSSSDSRSPQWLPPSLCLFSLSSLSLFFPLSCLCCLWQIGKLCFTNVGTCVKWGSIVCLTGCLY